MQLTRMMLIAALAACGRLSAAAGAGPVELDIPFAELDEQQKLPERKDFTTIVFTYGGGWHSGSRKSVTRIGEEMQRLGFGCALVSHRLSPKDKFPAQAEDLATAFAWSRRTSRPKVAIRSE